MEERGNQWRRILLYSAIGLAGAEGFFGLFSDLLDNGSQLGDAVGHLVGLPMAFAIFVVAMASVLQPGRRGRSPGLPGRRSSARSRTSWDMG